MGGMSDGSGAALSAASVTLPEVGGGLRAARDAGGGDGGSGGATAAGICAGKVLLAAAAGDMG